MCYVFVLIFLLSACASPTWKHQAAAPDQFKRDDYDCRVQNRSAHTIDFIPITRVDKGMYYRCMELRGWTRE